MSSLFVHVGLYDIVSADSILVWRHYGDVSAWAAITWHLIVRADNGQLIVTTTTDFRQSRLHQISTSTLRHIGHSASVVLLMILALQLTLLSVSQWHQCSIMETFCRHGIQQRRKNTHCSAWNLYTCIVFCFSLLYVSVYVVYFYSLMFYVYRQFCIIF